MKWWEKLFYQKELIKENKYLQNQLDLEKLAYKDLQKKLDNLLNEKQIIHAKTFTPCTLYNCQRVTKNDEISKEAVKERIVNEFMRLMKPYIADIVNCEDPFFIPATGTHIYENQLKFILIDDSFEKKIKHSKG